MSVVAERCEFHSGSVIDGRYEVIKELGEGSFGSVYKVRNQTGEIMALKLLKLWTVPPDVSDNLKKRFVMEYNTGQIQSGYLAHSYSYGEIDGNPYILMEFCPNGDLRSWLRSHDADYVKVGKQILYGLRDLHACGKVHRDLKPENVLMRADDTAVLTDFGISGDRNNRMTQRGFLGKPSQIFGTYPYMPPEQVNPPRGGKATVLPTTDIFSFGVMMYEMLVGSLPFGPLSESTLPKYLENGKSGKWDRKSLKRADWDGVWMDIIECCLVPDYKHRAQSADEVLKMFHDQPADDTEASVPYDRMPDNFSGGLMLRMMQGEEYGRIYRIDEMRKNSSVLRVGRGSSSDGNDISISDGECFISRRHCTLEFDGESGNWYLRDGQWISGYGWKTSLNGTYLNSTEVGTEGLQISPGDIITVGDVKLRVEACGTGR